MKRIPHLLMDYYLNRPVDKIQDIAATLVGMGMPNLKVFGITGVHYKSQDVKYLLIRDLVMLDDQGFFHASGYISLPTHLMIVSRDYCNDTGRDFVPLDVLIHDVGYSFTDGLRMDKIEGTPIPELRKYLYNNS